MPRITKVYTRTGDEGTTGLGGGQRVPKESLRVEAYGTVDELNSQLGVAIAVGLDDAFSDFALEIQNNLFHLGSDLCILEEDKEKFQVAQIEQRHVDALEELMDRLNEELGPLKNFILPGGDLAASHLHLARTICRRAERDVTRLSRQEAIGAHVLPFLNRLSDAFFVMARYQNHATGHGDVLWDSRR